VIEQKLDIDPAFKPIKQKERRYTPETRETIQVEVNKLLEAGFIKPVDYPRWLTNPVLVEKPDGSWRMCIDYTTLINYLKHVQELRIEGLLVLVLLLLLLLLLLTLPTVVVPPPLLLPTLTS
jgi:hypothetical protein